MEDVGIQGELQGKKETEREKVSPWEDVMPRKILKALK